jgi:integrase
MGWQAAPRWDKHNRRWHCTIAGRHVNLGRDKAVAYRRFAELWEGLNGRGCPPTAEALAKLWPCSTWERDCLKAWVAFTGGQLVAALPAGHLAAYANTLQRRGLSRRTVLAYTSTAERLLKWAGQRYGLPVPQHVKLARPVPCPKDLPHDEVLALLVKLPPVFTFIAATGCRPGEACRLDWADVNESAHTATLGVHRDRQHKTARTGKARVIYLSEHARQLLAALPGEHSGPVFLSRLKRAYTPAGLRSILKRRGISGAYVLRHTFAQHALDAGVADRVLAGLLGHTTTAMVNVYSHVRTAIYSGQLKRCGRVS